MKLISIMTLALIFFCNSCKDNSVNESTGKDFYPLSVGNYWRYQIITLDSIGTVISDSSYWLEKVIGDTTLNGERCYFLKQSRSPSSWFIAAYRNSTWLEKVIGDTALNGERCYFLKQSRSPSFWFIAAYRNSTEGLLMQADTAFTKYPLIYKYPARIDEIFSDSIRVIAVNEVISTVAGNLKCMVYQKFYSTAHTSLPTGWLCTKTYVVPGFGKVRVDGFYTSDKINLKKMVEYRLKEYLIN